MSAELATSLYCLRGSGATACASEARHLRRQVALVDSNVALRQASGTTRIQRGIRPRSESVRLGSASDPTRMVLGSDSESPTRISSPSPPARRATCVGRVRDLGAIAAGAMIHRPVHGGPISSARRTSGVRVEPPLSTPLGSPAAPHPLAR